MSKFQPGQSGNPNGRPAGTPNRRTQLLKLLEPHAEELITTLVAQAKSGDPSAMRLCIERLIPKLKAESPSVKLPKVGVNGDDALKDIRKALLLSLVQQEEVSIDSLRIILELCRLSEEFRINNEGEDPHMVKIKEIINRIHKEEY